MLNESALLAARRNKKKVEMTDIDDARDKVLWGRERRRVMDDKEKRALAWHEAGHAIVGAVLDDGTVPVHKVTIIPRGQSLGSTTYIPTKDILGRSKRQFLERICTAMAGRIGEAFITGDISDGASGDIKQATKIARAMVCDFGMSDLGPIAMGDNQDTVFLGRDITRSQHVSEDTARRIDGAVSEIIATEFKRAEKILGEHRAALDKVAESLLEHETIEGMHVLEIIKHGEIRSPITPVKPPKLPPADSAKPVSKGQPRIGRSGRCACAQPRLKNLTWFSQKWPAACRPLFIYEYLLHWSRVRRWADDGHDCAKMPRHHGHRRGHECDPHRRLEQRSIAYF